MVVSSIVINSDADVPIEFAGGWTLLADTADKPLQDAYSKVRLMPIFLHSVTVDERSSFIVSWLSHDTKVGPVIADQLEKLGEQAFNIVLQMAFKYIETIAFNASWIAGLNTDQRSYLDALVEDGVNSINPNEDTLLNRAIDLTTAKAVSFQRI